MDGGRQNRLGRMKRGKGLQARVATLGVIFKYLCYGWGFHFVRLEISLCHICRVKNWGQQDREA